MGRFDIKTDELSHETATSIWRAYYREAAADLTSVVLIIAFLMTGAAWIILSIFWSLKYTSLAAIGIGLLLGLLGAVCIL